MYDYIKGYIKHWLLVNVSFIIPPHSIFSLDVPKEQRLQAVRAAILLMPDENREVLQTLLFFLRDVTSLVEENQMTSMNLAVCLGPSLFHLSILKNEMLSPRCIYELMNIPMLTWKCVRINNAMYMIILGKVALAHLRLEVQEKIMSFKIQFKAILYFFFLHSYTFITISRKVQMQNTVFFELLNGLTNPVVVVFILFVCCLIL